MTYLPNTGLVFPDFPGLESEIHEFHDFPGFQWTVRTLAYFLDV